MVVIRLELIDFQPIDPDLQNHHWEPQETAHLQN